MAIEYTHEPRTAEGRLRHLLQSGIDFATDQPVKKVFIVDQADRSVYAEGLVSVYALAKKAGWLDYPNEGLDK